MSPGPRLSVVLVTEHASASFGGEAAIPLHYFRILRDRGIPVWLVTHDRVKPELNRLFPDDSRIVYITDKAWLRAAYWLGCHLPDQVAYITTGFLTRLSTALRQRRVVKRLVREHGITVVHQPTPVSPKEPSVMFGLGVPVVIGPMNGGMTYPPALATRQGGMEARIYGLMKTQAAVINRLLPGKRLASRLVIANSRTGEALHGVAEGPFLTIPENGVDLSLWRPGRTAAESARTEFVYLGRLVDWKFVDLLIRAFADVVRTVPAHLTIAGDGQERAALTRLAESLGLTGGTEDAVTFLGWLDQEASADLLAVSDVLVLPSVRECGGAVVLEAMAMGKPVIATAWGGPLDYLDDSCGVLVPPTSLEALQSGFHEAMVRLAGDPQLRTSLGGSGASKVRRDYDWEKKVDAMIGVYEDALASPQPMGR